MSPARSDCLTCQIAPTARLACDPAIHLVWVVPGYDKQNLVQELSCEFAVSGFRFFRSLNAVTEDRLLGYYLPYRIGRSYYEIPDRRHLASIIPAAKGEIATMRTGEAEHETVG